MTDQRTDQLEPADPVETDAAGVSWDAWMADHDEAWPTDDDAPDSFRRITP